MSDIINHPDSTNAQFAEITHLINNARNNVLRLANTALIDLYWNVGRLISERIASAEWGDGVVKQLADYISQKTPDLKGFSDKNLWRIKQFYETYANEPKLSPLVREISWTTTFRKGETMSHLLSASCDVC